LVGDKHNFVFSQQYYKPPSYIKFLVSRVEIGVCVKASDKEKWEKITSNYANAHKNK